MLLKTLPKILPKTENPPEKNQVDFFYILRRCIGASVLPLHACDARSCAFFYAKYD
nr:MAG TPA: DVL family [Caudoviricetes sp.]